MECPFVVGQRVLCIADNWRSVMSGRHDIILPNPPSPPLKGEVVTIVTLTSWPEGIFLSLSGREGRYISTKFRPVIEPDISVFETLLADVNAGKVKPVTEPA